MVVEAVWSEPVSAVEHPNFPVNRENTGNFFNFGANFPNAPAETQGICGPQAKFPKEQNREFLSRNREFSGNNREPHRRIRECIAAGSNPGPATTEN